MSTVSIKQKLLKEGTVYGLTAALSKLSIFIIIPIYTRTLSIDEFGLLDLYATIGGLLFIIAESQIHSGVMRSYYERKESNELHILVGSALTYYLLSNLTLIIFFIAIITGLVSHELLIAEYLLPLIALVLPSQIFELNNIILRMEHRTKPFFLMNIGASLAAAVFGILAAYLDFGIAGILWAMVISRLLFSIPAIYFVIKYTKPRLSLNLLGETLHYSLPIVPAVLGNWFIASSGRFFVADTLTSEQLSIYSLALKVGMVFMLFTQAFSMAWNPYAISRFNSTGSEATFAKAMEYYLLLGFSTLLLMITFSPIITTILAPSEYWAATSIVPIIIFTYFWQGLTNVIGIGNSWARKTYFNTLATLTGAVATLFLLWTLTEKLELVGAAVAPLFGTLVSATIFIWSAQSSHYIPYKYRSLAIYLIAGSVSIALSMQYSDLLEAPILLVTMNNLLISVFIIIPILIWKRKIFTS